MYKTTKMDEKTADSIRETYAKNLAILNSMTEEQRQAKTLKDLNSLFDYCHKKQIEERLETMGIAENLSRLQHYKK